MKSSHNWIVSDNQKDSTRYRMVSGIAHLLLLVVIILVAVGAVGYLAYQNAQLKQQAGEITTTTETTDQQTSEPNGSTETVDWKTYTNSNFGISFKYPSDLTHNAFGDDFGIAGYVRFKRGEKEIFTLSLSKESAEQGIGNYRGGKPLKKISIGSHDWNYYNFFYKDKMVDTLQYNIIAFETVKDDALYVFEFKEKSELTEEQNQILSTFEFLDEYRSSEKYLRVVAQNEILKYPSLVSEGYGSYQVESINIKDNWAAINYTSFSLTPASPDAHIVVPNIVLGAGRLTNDAWTVYIQNTEKFDSIKNDLPNWLQFLK